MTNEEAKEIIIKERDSLKANPIVKVEDCLYEALDMAIKALEQTRWIPVKWHEITEDGAKILTLCGIGDHGRMKQMQKSAQGMLRELW